jgi:hypothetical protein
MAWTDEQVDEMIYRILDAAEANSWEIEKMGPSLVHRRGLVQIRGERKLLAQTHEEVDLMVEAFDRMENERFWIRHVNGLLYKATEEGRKAFRRWQLHSKGGEKREVDPHLVFVVHGRDEKVRDDVELFLRRIGLKPIILFREVSGGKVVIEKFEHYAGKVGYALVLLTPEDIGYLKPEYNGGTKGADEERARQNVVFEMGFFFSQLGRGKVAALQKGHVSKPSDIDGIVYIPMKDGDMEWKVTLAKEMLAAGLSVEMSKI